MLSLDGLLGVKVSPPFKGGVARRRNRRTCRNINCLAGVVYLILFYYFSSLRKADTSLTEKVSNLSDRF